MTKDTFKYSCEKLKALVKIEILYKQIAKADGVVHLRDGQCCSGQTQCGVANGQQIQWSKCIHPKLKS